MRLKFQLFLSCGVIVASVMLMIYIIFPLIASKNREVNVTEVVTGTLYIFRYDAGPEKGKVPAEARALEAAVIKWLLAHPDFKMKDRRIISAHHEGERKTILFLVVKKRSGNQRAQGDVSNTSPFFDLRVVAAVAALVRPSRSASISANK